MSSGEKNGGDSSSCAVASDAAGAPSPTPTGPGITPLIDYDTFAKVDIRAGTIVRVEEFPEARKPAYKIWVDFGPELGVRQTSAQVTTLYRPDELLGQRVMGIVNLTEKSIAGFRSQFLLAGFDSAEGGVVLAQSERAVPNGSRLY